MRDAAADPPATPQRSWRNKRELPEVLRTEIDITSLAEAIGRQPSSVRRTLSEFVGFLVDEAMPQRPRDTLRFVAALQRYLVDAHWTTNGFLESIDELRAMASATRR